ncbi:TetR/AcrR family transcriptional regulator [Gracilimonas sp.]|uniref:TetR/AcrR family transcriptional regulator n=1 Tax=Gracilimonas sp. TaxID=1974203 RepID=UPI0032EE720C
MKYEKSDITKNKIIEESAHLFNVQGYAPTSMSDIEKATGFTKGCIYGHFNSKDDIAVAAFDYNRRILIDNIKSQVRSTEGSIDKLKAIIHSYKKNVNTPQFKGGCPILNTATESDDSYEVLRPKVKQTLNIWSGTVEEIIKNGIVAGEINEDVQPKKIASLFVSIYEGSIMLMKMYKDAQHMNYAFEQLENLIDEISKK